MTKKEKSIAKTAEQSIPQKNEATEDTKVVSEEQPQAATAFDLSKVDPEKVKLAEEMGVPVGQLLAWANSVETRLNTIQKEMPQQIQNAMTQAIENAQKKQREQYAQAVKEGNAPQGGGGDMMKQMFMRFLMGSGGGGEGDSEMKQLQKDLLKSAIDRNKKDSMMVESIVGAVVSKITNKAIGEVV